MTFKLQFAQYACPKNIFPRIKNLHFLLLDINDDVQANQKCVATLLHSKVLCS